jgi:hypothetical protein
MASQRRILAVLTAEITLVEVETATRLKDNREYRALLSIKGSGRSWRGSSSPRSVTCTGSAPPTSWRVGPG